MSARFEHTPSTAPSHHSAAEQAERAHRREVNQARSHYEVIIRTARKCAWEFESLASKGTTRQQAGELRRLANAFAWANVALGNAAREICRLEELANDGVDEGIIWEILL